MHLLTALSKFRCSVTFCKERHAVLQDRYLNVSPHPQSQLQDPTNNARAICHEAFNSPTLSLAHTLETLSLLLEIVEADAANRRKESLSRNLRLGESWIAWLQKGLRKTDHALCELEMGAAEIGVIGDGRLSPGSSPCCAVNIGTGRDLGVIGEGRPVPCAEVVAPVTMARAETPTPPRQSRFRNLFRTMAAGESATNAAPVTQTAETVVAARPSASFTFRFPIPNSEGMMPPPRPTRRVAEETGSPSRKRKFHTLSLSLSTSTSAEAEAEAVVQSDEEIAKPSSEPATSVPESEASTLINTAPLNPSPTATAAAAGELADDDNLTLLNSSGSVILLPSLPSSTYSEYDDLPEVEEADFPGPEFFARTGGIPPSLPTLARFSLSHEVVQTADTVGEDSVQSWLDMVPNPSVFQALDAGDEGVASYGEEDDEVDEVAQMIGDDEDGDDEFERFEADMAELAEGYDGHDAVRASERARDDTVNSEATTVRSV